MLCNLSDGELLTTYPKTNAYHFHDLKILLKVATVTFLGAALPASKTLAAAMSFSSCVRNHARVVYGVSGRKTYVASPTGTVMH
jgi:hypothetical protein